MARRLAHKAKSCRLGVSCLPSARKYCCIVGGLSPQTKSAQSYPHDRPPGRDHCVTAVGSAGNVVFITVVAFCFPCFGVCLPCSARYSVIFVVGWVIMRLLSTLARSVDLFSSVAEDNVIHPNIWGSHSMPSAIRAGLFRLANWIPHRTDKGRLGSGRREPMPAGFASKAPSGVVHLRLSFRVRTGACVLTVGWGGCRRPRLQPGAGVGRPRPERVGDIALCIFVGVATVLFLPAAKGT